MQSHGSNGSAPPGDEATVHLRDVWQVVVRRYWLVVLVFAVTLGAAAWVTHNRPQLYQSRMALQVSDPSARGIDLKLRRDVSLTALHVDPIRSEVEVLTSGPVALRVVEALGLRLQPEDPKRMRSELFDAASVAPGFPTGVFVLAYDETGEGVELRDPIGDRLARGRAGAPLGIPGLMLVPNGGRAFAGTRHRLAVVDAESAAAEVLAGLRAAPKPETNVVDVWFTSRDPVFAPRILHAAAEALRDHGVDRSRVLASSQVRFLNEQLAESFERLQDALSRVQGFKSSHAFTNLSSEEQNVFAQIKSYQGEAEELAIETYAYASLIQQLQAGAVDRADLEHLASVASLNANATLQYHLRQLVSLRDERNARTSGAAALDVSHPDVQGIDSRIQQTESRLLHALRGQLDAVEQRRARLASSASEGRARLARFPELEQELDNLELQKDIYLKNHQWLLSEMQRAQLAEAVVAPYVDIVDPAGFAVPVRTRGALNLGLAAMLGLMLGAASALFLDYLDRTLRTSTDILTRLRLPTLALIPRVSRSAARPTPEGARRRPAGAPLLIGDPLLPAAEAYRTLQVGLAFARSADDPLRTLVVTSTAPGEGKSTTTLNLATALANEGRRVLLVDADLRNPSLHHAFGAERGPGLSNVIIGAVTLDAAVRSEVLPGVDALFAGPLPPNPAELFASRTLADLLAELRERYDRVLIDSPPVLAVNDASLLARLADGVLFVVRAGDTLGDAAAHAVERLRRVGGRTVGAVLNEVDRLSSPDSTYTQYYYSYNYSAAPRRSGKRRMRELAGSVRFW